ncbi:Endonuclease/exonuclease/phosphatase [Sesbania bispinosa]|nr:Endonuclease/exonuclease/phosphatase [Sesbania bispinosa]
MCDGLPMRGYQGLGFAVKGLERERSLPVALYSLQIRCLALYPERAKPKIVRGNFFEEGIDIDIIINTFAFVNKERKLYEVVLTMKDENSKKSKLSWPKTLVKKWFNIKSKAEDFQADDVLCGGVDEEYRSNYSEREAYTIKKSKTERSSRRYSDRTRRGKNDVDEAQDTDVYNYRIFVATWNVAGKSPPSYLSLEDWLHTSPPADIYVLGFQEIVPLNAGNVLGTEDNGPARKWLALIRRTLNSLPGTSGGCHTPSPLPAPIVELDADFEGSMRQKATSFFHRRSFQALSRSMRMDNDMSMPQPSLDRRLSVCDRMIFGHRMSDYDSNYRWGSSDDENVTGDSPITTQYSPMSYGGCFSMEDNDRQTGHSRYCLVASKQMVGIFLTVWVKSDIRDYVHNMKVSCVGRGLMGYLGNKGSISISMSLHQTSFCFVCSHLTSGQKDGDELRRNSDVMEILRKTRFPQVHDMGDENSPQTILEHDEGQDPIYSGLLTGLCLQKSKLVSVLAIHLSMHKFMTYVFKSFHDSYGFGHVVTAVRNASPNGDRDILLLS